MFIPNIFMQEAYHRLITKGYDIALWSMKDLRKNFGISYQDIYYLEKNRIISPVNRNKKGRLFWTPLDLKAMIDQIRNLEKEKC